MSAADFFATRVDHRAKFLNDAGLTNGMLTPVGADAAIRRYFRLYRKDGASVILLESIPPGHALTIPGHDLGDFVRIAAWLREQGLHAPEVLLADVPNGYLLLEDFGDTSFKIALEKNDAAMLYGLAIDVLKKLHGADASALHLPNYYASHVHTGRRRVVDWYMPALRSAQNPDGLVEEYFTVWDAIEKNLPPCPQGFLHIDYHVENLMWLPAEKNLAACGILDFQGAMLGPQPYDLANLLEDARHTIADDLRAAMLDRFCASMPPTEAKNFRAWYRILATQFHCRIIGQFIRLAIHFGKPQYLRHLPRLAAYLERGLADPLLKPLQDWFIAQGISFANIPAIDIAETTKFIRSDAF